MFITYENRDNPHLTIHREECSQPRKRGGDHKYDQGNYRDHPTLEQAEANAKTTGLPVIRCAFCKP